MSLYFRLAQVADVQAIAALHTRSWQENYRGSFADQYLDEVAPQERLVTWTNRLNTPSDKQWVLLAEENNELLGFACVYLDHDDQWGALLDNLHVRGDHKGKGIGRQLFQRAQLWVKEQRPGQPMYLFVLADNQPAIAAYSNWGGQLVEKLTEPIEMIVDVEPDGSELEAYRYVWT